MRRRSRSEFARPPGAGRPEDRVERGGEGAASRRGARSAPSRPAAPATPGPATSTGRGPLASRARRRQAGAAASRSRRPSTTIPAATIPSAILRERRSGRSASSHKPTIIPSRVQPSSRRARDETDPRPSGHLPRWHRFSAPTTHRMTADRSGCRSHLVPLSWPCAIPPSISPAESAATANNTRIGVIPRTRFMPVFLPQVFPGASDEVKGHHYRTWTNLLRLLQVVRDRVRVATSGWDAVPPRRRTLAGPFRPWTCCPPSTLRASRTAGRGYGLGH